LRRKAGKSAAKRRIGRKKPRRPVVYREQYEQGFDKAYNDGYNAGFAKGFEDGHQLAYEQQI